MICKDCGNPVEEDPECRIPCPHCGSTKRKITAHAGTKAPALEMTPPSTTPQSLLAAANNLVQAIDLLVAANARVSLATGLLGAHSLEIALKAFLLHQGYAERDLINRVGHDLQEAWRQAVEHRLPLEVPTPHWCELLDACHKRPYIFRYPPSNTVMILPNPEVLLQELRRVMRLVEEALESVA